ncbi:MAG: GNAT family N-acetyltransferase [Chloroflexota bacterium]
MIQTTIPEFRLRPATDTDIPIILSFIQELADYEQLAHEVVATEEILRRNLFGERQVAEVILGYWNDEPVSFALFFHNFSTFLGKPGLYLEDLYVKSEMRGRGIGTTLLSYLAKLAVERNCGRFEWSVLDWNEPAIRVYRAIGAEGLDEWTVQRVTGEALTQLARNFDTPKK